jgi:hypothetical protein
VTLGKQVEQLRAAVAALEAKSDSKIIEATAKRLEGCNYSPPVLTPIPVFLRLDTDGVLAELDRILSMPDTEACALAPDDSMACDELRLQAMKVLIYYFEKLVRLRDGDTEEWDEVDELYVHD